MTNQRPTAMRYTPGDGFEIKILGMCALRFRDWPAFCRMEAQISAGERGDEP